MFFISKCDEFSFITSNAKIMFKQRCDVFELLEYVFFSADGFECSLYGSIFFKFMNIGISLTVKLLHSFVLLSEQA